MTAHELRVSTNGGSSWSSAPLGGASTLSGSSPMAVVLLKPGTNYQLSARSSDGNGNWSEWVSTPTFDLLMTQGEASAVGISGSWTTKSVAKTLGGQLRFGKQANAKATFTFTGRELAIVGFTRPKGGRAEIYVNGNPQTTIDTRSSSKVKRTIVFNRTWASSATRTVEVVVLGTKDRPRVDIDAFIVLR